MVKFYIKAYREQLNEVKSWLSKKHSSNSNGFYNNIDNIENSFNLNEMSCLMFENQTIGFATWRLQERIAFIDIFEIHPTFNKRGFGKLLFKELTSYFISRGIYAIELRFISEESKAFWIKMGFQKFKGTDFPSVTDKHLYKVIVKSQSRIIGDSSNSYIEIWDNTCMSSNKPSLIAYDLMFENDSSEKLALPIVTPCNHDWTMSLNLDNSPKILKIKHFDFIKYYPNFLIIESL